MSPVCSRRTNGSSRAIFPAWRVSQRQVWHHGKQAPANFRRHRLPAHPCFYYRSQGFVGTTPLPWPSQAPRVPSGRQTANQNSAGTLHCACKLGARLAVRGIPDRRCARPCEVIARVTKLISSLPVQTDWSDRRGIKDFNFHYSGLFHEQFIGVTPQPILSGLKRPDHRVGRLVIVPGGMLVFR